MEKITLKEAFKQASVVDDLKNFVGLDSQNALGLMTPERLAAVAGEKIGIERVFISIETNQSKVLNYRRCILLICCPYANRFDIINKCGSYVQSVCGMFTQNSSTISITANNDELKITNKYPQHIIMELFVIKYN